MKQTLPKIIGVTGGIGSGKSVVMSFLESKGIPIYISDFHAKEISNSELVFNKMKLIWGDSIITNNVFDRKKLGSIVFNDKNELEKLNNLIHPLVKTHWENWLKSNQSHKWVAKESAILLQVGGKKYCDFIICVTAKNDVRVNRIMKRDGLSQVEAQQRIDAQWSDQQMISEADFVIENNDLLETKEALENMLKIFNI